MALMLWPKWKFKFVSRCANASAHALAKWSVFAAIEGPVPLNCIPVNYFCDVGFPIVDSFHFSFFYIN